MILPFFIPFALAYWYRVRLEGRKPLEPGGLQSRNFKQLYSGILAVTCVNFNFFGEFEIITKQWRL